MPVGGKMNVVVKYGSQTANLTLTVVEGSEHILFGQDWLGQLQLDWKIIGLARLSEQDTQIEALKKKYDISFFLLGLELCFILKLAYIYNLKLNQFSSGLNLFPS